MRCAYHSDVETNLSCGKCGKPICPRCLVQTEVGIRCRECAKLYKLPTYQVSTLYYLRAVGTAFGMAIVCGIFWAVAGRFLLQVTHFSFNLLLAPGIGYVIGEVMSRSVNRKRGTGLAIIAGGALVISYFVSIFFPWGLRFGLFDLLALALGIFVAVNRLR